MDRDRLGALLGLGAAAARAVARLLASSLAGGIAGGLALGVLLRLAMRLAAVVEGGTEFTAEGTAVILVTSSVGGTALSLVCGLLRRVVRVPAGPAAAAFAALGTAFVAATTGGELAERGVLWMNVLAFTASFAAYGWIVVRAQERVEHWWDHRGRAA